MMGKWTDAHATFVSFIEAEQTQELSQEKKQKLHLSRMLITHYFSLMHAIALVQLMECEGQLYGRVSDEGQQAVGHFRTVPLGKDARTTFEDLCKTSDDQNFADKTDWPRRLAVLGRVERFGRRGTEPFEPFEPFEFFQNRKFPEFFLRKCKISENFNIF